jgi:DNA-binding transcriptional LysR family regulator
MAVDRSCAAAGVTRTIAYEVNDTATMVEFIRTGLAVGMLPASLVDNADEIAFVPIRNHPPQFRTAIAIPANRRLSAATRALLETIKRHPARDRRTVAAEPLVPRRPEGGVQTGAGRSTRVSALRRGRIPPGGDA